MHIDIVPNRNSPPAVLLRESYREGGKVKKRTLANLSCLPDEVVQGLKVLLKGGTAIPADQKAIVIERSLPHGHVAATLGTVRLTGLDRVLGPAGNRCRDLVIAMIVARLTDTGSKLSTARSLDPATATSSLGAVLGLGSVDEGELYTALDWLLERQPAVEAALAKKHLQDGTLVLYDVSSSYVEGRKCPLAQRGYSRDDKKGSLQIVYGLLCAPDGCPVAVEVFDGNVGDPKTVADQIVKLKERFGLSRVVLVGDRGMITETRITEDLKPAGIDWITALRAPAIRALMGEGAIQMSLFDWRDMAAVTSAEFPGERLIVCRNPLLAEERARKREDLLRATEADLETVQRAVMRTRAPLRGAAAIGLKVGAVLNAYKVGKHFETEITDAGFSFRRKADAIAEEARLDGFYVIRTSVPEETLDDTGTVRAYKSLAKVERAFRTLKGVDLQVRPIHHWLEPRVRAHVFLCMLSYYVEWHMRRRLAPMLFHDADPAAAEAERDSIVAPAVPSPSAQAKVRTGTSDVGTPVMSFRSVLADLATIARNTVFTALAPDHRFTITTRPTAIQRQAFDLLGVSPDCSQ